MRDHCRWACGVAPGDAGWAAATLGCGGPLTMLASSHPVTAVQWLESATIDQPVLDRRPDYRAVLNAVFSVAHGR